MPEAVTKDQPFSEEMIKKSMLMPTQKRLNGKVAIVTGGATGIGEAVAKKFAQQGAKVVIAAFPEDPVDGVVKEINDAGGTAVAYKGDISRPSSAQECVKKAVEEFGQLNILINNAGVFPLMEELQDYPIDAYDYMIRHNIDTVFLMSRFAIPELQKTQGCIVSAGSEAGMIGLACNTAYGGTKGWIHAFMRGLAVEQARYGVRCNCVCPGPIDTSWTHKETGPMDKEEEDNLMKATPMARRGTPEEVANVYLFLASDEASFVTGALYAVDGGITVGKGPIGDEAGRKVKKQPKGELELKHSLDGGKSHRKWIQTELGKGKS